ncbi:hypothetical protein JCM10213_002003 [Rhodosporidiobolus nylandii]
MSAPSTRAASPTTSTPLSSSTSSTPAPSSAALSAAELKRQHRAAKKAEQQARKEERKRLLEETGVDPALLPASLAGEFALGGGYEISGFRPREWVEVPQQDGDKTEGRRVKVLSWNMLAQALVRRELFPGSDYLKGKDRLPALMQEVTYYGADIVCLQEADRLSTHLPILTRTHGYSSFVGYPNKAHGLVIAHSNRVFTKVGEKGIRLDDLPVDDSAATATGAATPPADIDTPSITSNGTSTPSSADSASDAPAAEGKQEKKDEDERPPDAPSAPSSEKASRKAAGISRVTRNVGLFVALEFKDQPGRGVIVGTTHLFWAGEYVYERTRQTGILFREARRFREEAEGGRWKDWPIMLAGDFNTQPFELTYRLAVSPSSPVPPALLHELERSRVVHHSVEKLHDPSFEPPTPPQAEAKEGEEAAGDGAMGDASDDPTLPHDKPIKNSRPAAEDGSDGIVGLDELRALFSSTGARSAYGEAYGLCAGEGGRWYCDRPPGVQAGNGWRLQESEEVKMKRKEGAWEERVKRGDFEPIYSNFTPLWRCTLDYIFILPPAAPSDSPAPPRIRSLLSMHDFAQTCEPGLPRKGIEPSDHVAIGAVVEVP